MLYQKKKKHLGGGLHYKWDFSTSFPILSSPIRRENSFPTSLDSFKQTVLPLAELPSEIFITKVPTPAP